VYSAKSTVHWTFRCVLRIRLELFGAKNGNLPFFGNAPNNVLPFATQR
jgi:hypothetical protein